MEITLKWKRCHLRDSQIFRWLVSFLALFIYKTQLDEVFETKRSKSNRKRDQQYRDLDPLK